MYILSICYIDPCGELLETKYGGPTLEGCLELLTYMVARDWQLIHVEIKAGSGHPFPLLVEAFDGEDFTSPLMALQEQWHQELTRTC